MSSPRLDSRSPSPERCLSVESRRESRSRSRSYDNSRSRSASSSYSRSRSSSASRSFEESMSDAQFKRLNKKAQKAFIEQKETRNLLLQKHAAEQWETVARKNIELSALQTKTLNTRLELETTRLRREKTELAKLRESSPERTKRKRSPSPPRSRVSRSRSPPLVRRRSRSPPKCQRATVSTPTTYYPRSNNLDSYRPVYVNPGFYEEQYHQQQQQQERKVEKPERRPRGGRAMREREARRREVERERMSRTTRQRSLSPIRPLVIPLTSTKSKPASEMKEVQTVVFKPENLRKHEHNDDEPCYSSDTD